jgi:hypothetical protein
MPREHLPPMSPRAPTSVELVQRLEKDIAWLKRRDVWTRAMFERAVARYIDARASTEQLDAFVARHADPTWLASVSRRAG